MTFSLEYPDTFQLQSSSADEIYEAEAAVESNESLTIDDGIRHLLGQVALVGLEEYRYQW